MATDRSAPPGDDGGRAIGIVEATEENIQRAADVLRRGDLVVMPTETVYGLACIATDVDAVRKVFAAKGRPAENPLIVHLASMDQVGEVASEFGADARALADAFWPGPLSLVLPKRNVVPDEVTAGLDTVAVRVPAHPIAHRLLAAVSAPLAAPSANQFMAISPTRAEDVTPEISASAAMILDGGPTDYGIESTVVSCVGTVRILRPGGISRRELEEVLGRSIESGEEKGRAPGQYTRHYAPNTPVRLADRLAADDAGLPFEIALNEHQIPMSRDPREYAAKLYRSMQELDRRGLPEIVVQSPPDSPEWDAVWDRLRKASG